MTVVVGLDARTSKQFVASSPTWIAAYPELLRARWLVFFDQTQLPGDAVLDALERVLPAGVAFDLMSWGLGTEYESQREKMLTGFVLGAPFRVRTDWWIKIDTDALAERRSDWPNPDWFRGEDGRTPAIVASPWGYTKPADQMARLDAWATVAGVPGEPLNLPVEPGASRCCHPRIASWLSFYRTSFTLDAARYCEPPASRGSGVAAYKMPVPSQDGFHWYMSRRLGELVVRANMKRRGWTNISSFDKLKARADEILGK
jgi:hypothetical protein